MVCFRFFFGFNLCLAVVWVLGLVVGQVQSAVVREDVVLRFWLEAGKAAALLLNTRTYTTDQVDALLNTGIHRRLLFFSRQVYTRQLRWLLSYSA